MSLRSCSSALWTILLPLVWSCGAGAPARAIAPKAQTAEEALGEADGKSECKSPNGKAQPLVVDWKSDRRADLELAMKEGLAVVAYDCGRFELLKDCKVKGSYGFAGVSLKEDVVQLSGKDDLAVNLPFSSATLSTQLDRGSSIDLALALVGRKGTTVRQVVRKQLEGECTGASHVVRGVYVGAFAMTKGTYGNVRAAAEIFGMGVSGGSASKSATENRDGTLAACKEAKPSEPTPPERCQAAIRVDLIPITTSATTSDDSDTGTAAGAPEDGGGDCSGGRVLAGGICTTKTKAQRPYRCKPSDFEECQTQCSKGDGASCRAVGFFFKGGRKDQAGQEIKADPQRALQAYTTACERGDALGCHELGMMILSQSRELEKSDPPKAKKVRNQAEEAFLKACELGEAWSCWNSGSWYLRTGAMATAAPFGTNPTLGISLYERSCNLGYAPGCSSLADERIIGKNTKKDAGSGMKLLERACDAGEGRECEKQGDYLREGKVVAADKVGAIMAFTRGCKQVGFKKSYRACAKLGEMYAKGEGVTADLPKAIEAYKAGCPDTGSTGVEACRALALTYEKGQGVKAAPALAAEYYTRSCGNGDCLKAGGLYEKGATGKPDYAKAAEAYTKGCKRFGDKDACLAQGRLLEKDDKAQAKVHYLDVCQRLRHDASCKAYVKLGGDVAETKKPYQPPSAPGAPSGKPPTPAPAPGSKSAPPPPTAK